MNENEKKALETWADVEAALDKADEDLQRAGFDVTNDEDAARLIEWVEKLDKINALALEALDWVGQTVHRAHHEGPLHLCKKATCSHIRDVMSKCVEVTTGRRVKP